MGKDVADLWMDVNFGGRGISGEWLPPGDSVAMQINYI